MRLIDGALAHIQTSNNGSVLSANGYFSIVLKVNLGTVPNRRGHIGLTLKWVDGQTIEEQLESTLGGEWELVYQGPYEAVYSNVFEYV